MSNFRFYCALQTLPQIKNLLITMKIGVQRSCNRDSNWISVGRLRGMKRSQVIVAPSAVDDVTEISFFKKKAAIILAFNSEAGGRVSFFIRWPGVQLMATDADGWRWMATNEASRVEDIRRITMARKGRAKWAQWTLLEADCLARMQRKGAPLSSSTGMESSVSFSEIQPINHPAGIHSRCTDD